MRLWFLFYYFNVCVSLSGTISPGAADTPFVIYSGKLWAFFFFFFLTIFPVADLFVKAWLFMKADRKPGSGWSKASRTNICTRTSILSPAARGGVKHNEVVKRAAVIRLCAQRRGKARQSHGYLFIQDQGRGVTADTQAVVQQRATSTWVLIKRRQL